ncbi:MAG: hypothetical protein MUO62_01995 [Anaerolineales bacterium]|nr:hypothetical protein [Anaerolineales bacterium]
MMKNQIPQGEINQLSAYLDQQLKPGEMARIEARLEKEPGLKTVLEDLRRTRTLLQAAPRARAPRNFTLRPEMVGQTRDLGTRLVPAFRLVSVIASLLFVLVVAGDFLGVGQLRSGAMEEMAAPQLMMVKEAEADLQMEAVEAPAVEAPVAEAPIAEMVGEAGEMAATNLETEDTPLADLESAPAAEDRVEKSAGLPEEAQAEETAVVMLEAVPTQGCEPPAEKEISAQVEAPQPEREGLPEGIPEESLAEEPSAAEPMEAPTSLDEQDEQDELAAGTNLVEELAPEAEPPIDGQAWDQEPGPRWSVIRVVEVVLGLAALGAGMLAFYCRRRV